MKRIFALFLVVLLSSCSLFRSGTDDNNMWEAKKNTECADFNSVKVFQTLQDSALAMVCDSGNTKYCSGMVVVVPKKWDLQLWDEKVVTPPKGKCFVYGNTVEYKTKNNEKKTVPVLDFEYKYSAKSAEEAIDRLEQKSADFSKNCHLNFENEKDASLKKEGIKFCKCLESFEPVTEDEVKEIVQEVNKQEVVSSGDVRYFYSQTKYIAVLEDCTKKYPKAAKAY